jgi:putative component of toxin-antitoxin plasmid stabilization module
VRPHSLSRAGVPGAPLLTFNLLATSFVMSSLLSWSRESSSGWSLSGPASAAAAARVEHLVEHGAALRMPRSRSLGEGLFELRFDLGRTAQRISFFFPGERHIVLPTTFHKQRQNESSEVARARNVMKVCIDQGHTAEDED